MRLLLVIGALYTLNGCQTPTQPAPQPVPLVQWDVVAPGCTPNLPLPVLQPQDRLISRTEKVDTLDFFYQRPNDSIFVTFKKNGTNWQICEWDNSDI